MNRGKEILVGVVLVAAVGVAVVGTLWMQEYGWGRVERTLEARVLDAGQLMEGNDVKLRGVSIGQVRRIEVMPDGRAVRVTLRVEDGVTLPDDPVVILSPESMFGDWQAQITSRSRFPRYSYTEPTEDDVLPGHTLPDISQLTATADEIAGNLRTLSERVEMAFTEETAQNIAQTVDNIQDISQRLGELVGQQAETFSNLATRMEESAGELSSAARSVRQTFDRVDTLLGGGEMESILADVEGAAGNIRNLSGDLAQSTDELGSTLARADTTFVRLNEITGQIAAGEGTLGRLLTDTTFVNRAEGTLTELQTLLEDFRQNPSRYVRLSIF
ncbi:MAG: MlaD family protein [Longimicrobiales bacterium]